MSLFVRALFGNRAILHQKNPLRIPNGRKPVRDDERRAVFADFQHGATDLLLCDSIYRAGRFIQDQDRRVGEDGPRDGDQLAFSL